MVVAFWSNIGGKNAVTGNLACVSAMMAMEYQGKYLVMENHCQFGNIETAWVKNGAFDEVRESQNYLYQHVGMDALVKRIHANMLGENGIESTSRSFLGKKLFYIPQSQLIHPDLLEYELNQVVEPLLIQAREFADITFIDVAGSNHLSTKVILEKADLVVVNVSQDPNIINHFFEHYSSLLDKAFFLIGNYNPSSRFNLANIRRKYRIQKEKIAVIPYQISYKDAMTHGAVLSFLSRNHGCRRADVNYYFIKEVRRATKMIHGIIMDLSGRDSGEEMGA